MALPLIALTPAIPSELLTYILTHQAYPTSLIICQPRAAFLSSLFNGINHTSPPIIPDEERSSQPPNYSNYQPPERHPLLVPTLHQVAISRVINLVFVPTVSHLRAYLAVFPPPETNPPLTEQNFDKPGNKVPSLVVYGLVGLHRDTSEWGAQGLGNSLSGLVEAGWRCGRRVVVMEEREVGDVGEGESEGGEVEGLRRENGLKGWEERVPMLNGSVRRAGLESEDGGWSGRTVEVGRILGRWFKFRRGDWDCNEQAG